MSLGFSVAPTTRPARYVANDGQHWLKESDAQSHNALIASQKILTKRFFDKSVWGYTILGNICDGFSIIDIVHVRAVITKWLNEVQPAIEAIEGEIGYHVGPQKREQRLITTDDGRSHGSRAEAASHLLMVALQALRPTLSWNAQIAICNDNRYSDRETQIKRMTQFQYDRGWRALLSFSNYTVIQREDVEKFDRVLEAIYAAKAARVEAI